MPVEAMCRLSSFNILSQGNQSTAPVMFGGVIRAIVNKGPKESNGSIAYSL